MMGKAVGAATALGAGDVMEKVVGGRSDEISSGYGNDDVEGEKPSMGERIKEKIPGDKFSSSSSGDNMQQQGLTGNGNGNGNREKAVAPPIPSHNIPSDQGYTESTSTAAPTHHIASAADYNPGSINPFSSETTTSPAVPTAPNTLTVPNTSTSAPTSTGASASASARDTLLASSDIQDSPSSTTKLDTSPSTLEHSKHTSADVPPNSASYVSSPHSHSHSPSEGGSMESGNGNGHGKEGGGTPKKTGFISKLKGEVKKIVHKE